MKRKIPKTRVAKPKEVNPKIMTHANFDIKKANQNNDSETPSNQSSQLEWWEKESIVKSSILSYAIEESSSSGSIDLGQSSDSEILPKRMQSSAKPTSVFEIDGGMSDDELDLGESYSDSINEDEMKEQMEEKKTQREELKEKMEKMEIEKQNTVKKVRARRLSVSDDAGLDAYKPNGIPLINLETKSPLIWTIGVPVITLIVFILQIVQEGGIAQPNKNPMIGPSEEVSVIFGAKSYKEILEGSFWRYITANFVETNLVHFIISLFLVFACKDVEANSGFWRAFLVFSISGIYGYILSSLCAPWVISGGFSGALFGHIGLILSDIISTWRMHDSEKRKKLTFISIVSVTALLAGFTPFVDNFPHYGGIIMGFLASLMLIPNMSFNEFERRCHGITAFLAFPVLSILFTLTTIFVYRGTSSGDYICMWCKYLTCINIGNWCPVVEGGTAVIKNWN